VNLDQDLAMCYYYRIQKISSRCDAFRAANTSLAMCGQRASMDKRWKWYIPFFFWDVGTDDVVLIRCNRYQDGPKVILLINKNNLVNIYSLVFAIFHVSILSEI